MKDVWGFPLTKTKKTEKLLPLIVTMDRFYVSSCLLPGFHYYVAVLDEWGAGNYPELERQSVMACHSMQTDKLLCCQSGHQIKHTARELNGQQEDEKISPCFITIA